MIYACLIRHRRLVWSLSVDDRRVLADSTHTLGLVAVTMDILGICWFFRLLSKGILLEIADFLSVKFGKIVLFEKRTVNFLTCVDLIGREEARHLTSCLNHLRIVEISHVHLIYLLVFRGFCVLPIEVRSCRLIVLYCLTRKGISCRKRILHEILLSHAEVLIFKLLNPAL